MYSDSTTMTYICTFSKDLSDEALINLFKVSPVNDKIIALMNGSRIIKTLKLVNINPEMKKTPPPSSLLSSSSSSSSSAAEEEHYVFEVSGKHLFFSEPAISVCDNDTNKIVKVFVEAKCPRPFLISPYLSIKNGDEYFTKPFYWVYVGLNLMKIPPPPSKNAVECLYRVRPKIGDLIFDPIKNQRLYLELDVQTYYWRFVFLPIFELRFFVKCHTDKETGVITLLRVRKPSSSSTLSN